ncbi:MAG TPA: DUF485 domain-containing protein [Candidatus Avipropionibacterium avicola]|uniref:DUF485 domain-containing protein n=1 Tax=Candidatus Avipropionibacterium avicola TaxID=2840701 RepID=A0A9D1GW15_9ACTN|nr:DUF485 domain-containing protein [Candidatus Avipropionibacterium avicola]
MSTPSDGSTPSGGPAASAPVLDATPEDFVRVQASPEFRRLRFTFRAFAIPMTVVFLVWYFLYVGLSTYAEPFMSTPVIGNLNVGLTMGLLQFVSTFLITGLYVRHANRKVDPIATALREELETEVPVEEARAIAEDPNPSGMGTPTDPTDLNDEQENQR